MSVLNEYNVKFSIEFGNKIIHTNNGLISTFLYEHHLITVNELVDIFTQLSTGKITFLEWPTQSLMLCIASPIETKFYDDGNTWYDNQNAPSDFVMPTSDFRIILEAWRDFLTK